MLTLGDQSETIILPYQDVSVISFCPDKKVGQRLWLDFIFWSYIVFDRSFLKRECV